MKTVIAAKSSSVCGVLLRRLQITDVIYLNGSGHVSQTGPVAKGSRIKTLVSVSFRHVRASNKLEAAFE